MSEKLCLQWNDFKANVNSAFGKLRDDKEFTDVTLACEDGQQLEAHKVILIASSPFFEKILQDGKHPHPLIYLRGFQSNDLVAILDFLYFGEANVYQENLDSFLAIAEELKLKGLTNQTSNDLLDLKETIENPKAVKKSKEMLMKSATSSVHPAMGNSNAAENVSTALTIPNDFNEDLQGLDEKVKSLMEKSQKMVPNGPLMKTKAFICKICGKEARPTHIRDHIEANHLDGIALPCDRILPISGEICGKIFSARRNLVKHKTRFH